MYLNFSLAKNTAKTRKNARKFFI